ncbi:hypothetical protein GP644_14640 [Parasedimentitalea maritima]|uniref:SnoaL-like domain-containing protein n=1 Tax=Parasedimentitalea maritima TaxID=2578117 RepID=A0A6A4R9E0_9RHOB|nr:hypothetical protein GP644_14640 [Zongyanglinia marina]
MQFDEYATAYCAQILDRLMAIYVEDILLIGTGTDEMCSGRALAARLTRQLRQTLQLRHLLRSRLATRGSQSGLPP